MKEQDIQILPKTINSLLTSRRHFLKSNIILTTKLTPLLIFNTISWSMDNSSLNGTYAIYEIENNLWHGTPSFDRISVGKGEITFDGAGGFTENSFTGQCA